MYARRILLPLLVIFSLLIVACGAPSDTGTTGTTGRPAASTAASSPAASDAGAAAPATGGQVELRLAWWGSQSRHDRTLKVIEMFQKEHPNIKITPEYGNFDDHWTKLATQTAGGNLPDIVQQDYSRIGEWAKRGLMLPLDDYVADGTIKLDGVAEEQLSGGKIDGKLYGVNLGTNALGVLYDPEMFTQAGVAEPSADWKWADLQQTATTLHEKLNVYGVETFYNAEFFKLWLKDNGKWMYSDDGKSLGYEDDALATQFFQKLVEMQESGATPTREFDAGRGTIGIEDSLIVTKKSAMIFVWSNMPAAISAASGDRELNIALPPQADNGGQGVYLKPSMFFSVAATSKHPKEAAMFVDYFTNNVEANKILAAERGVPIAPAVREALQPELPAIQQKVFEYIATAEKVAAPINPPDPAAHSKILSDVYNPLIDQLLYGELTPEAAAKQFREQATPLLASQ
ncbi:MAG: sugar ABC transporter substrate-binding protein [Chloroflexi bacterium]|nr:sugar ABC transporter substrate-binding protein [Chloroflexota bacterium]